jgi:hypothetical protein
VKWMMQVMSLLTLICSHRASFSKLSYGSFAKKEYATFWFYQKAQDSCFSTSYCPHIWTISCRVAKIRTHLDTLDEISSNS